MALDVHAYENGKIGRLLFQIDDKAFGDLRSAFELFRQCTGLAIDPFGDLVVDAAPGTHLSLDRSPCILIAMRHS
jgi:hypothetical protein